MKTKLLGLIASMALLVGATVGGHASPYVVTLDQVGANVVATGSGEFDLTGLTAGGTGEHGFTIVGPMNGVISTGVSAPSNTDLYYGISGPSQYGLGGYSFASSSSGGFVGVYGPGSTLYVPAGYTSGSTISSSATWDGQTFATLEATPGTYIWTWGTGAADQSFRLNVGTTPLPAALPLFAGGLGVIGLIAGRKKRKAADPAVA